MPVKSCSAEPGSIVFIDGQPALIMYVAPATKTVYYVNLKINLTSFHNVGAPIPGYDGEKLGLAYEEACRKTPKYSVGDKVISNGKTYRVIQVHGTAAFSDMPVRYTVVTEAAEEIYEDDLAAGDDELATSAAHQLDVFVGTATIKAALDDDSDVFKL